MGINSSISDDDKKEYQIQVQKLDNFINDINEHIDDCVNAHNSKRNDINKLCEDISNKNKDIEILKKENDNLKDIVLDLLQRIENLEIVHSDAIIKKKEANRKYYEKYKNLRNTKK